MEYRLRELTHPSDDELLKIARLWSASFGDSGQFIYDFYKKMPVHSTVCVYFGDIPVSMAVLLCVGDGYYGYAVCTNEAHRGRGLCRMVHGFIKEKCEKEEKEYFIHPATDELTGFYTRLGMRSVLSSYEVRTLAYAASKVKKCTPEEYFRVRDLYFGGGRFYPWSVSALSFMAEGGIDLLVSCIDGEECAAAVEGDTVIELCAPDHLSGKAAMTFLSGENAFGKVRFLAPADHSAPAALMSFSGKDAYFNLFFE